MILSSRLSSRLPSHDDGNDDDADDGTRVLLSVVVSFQTGQIRSNHVALQIHADQLNCYPIRIVCGTARLALHAFYKTRASGRVEQYFCACFRLSLLADRDGISP